MNSYLKTETAFQEEYINHKLLIWICSMVLKVKYDRTFQGYTNNSSSRGSAVMFDLSKSVSQLYLSIYGDKIDFFLYKQHCMHLLYFMNKDLKVDRLSKKKIPIYKL